MTNQGAAVKKAALMAGTCVVLFLLVEGILSLTAGISLWPRPEREGPSILRTDEDRRAAAATAPGIFRVHEDPRVGFVLRCDEGLAIRDSRIDTDALGMRTRTGPPPTADAVRILVLGDSVAFGWGLNNDQTIASHLEEILNQVRGPAAPPVACFTAAAPGWNHRNSVYFLFNHFEALKPHIVLYMPVPNDLVDTMGVNESAHHHIQADLVNPDPWLQVSLENHMVFINSLIRQDHDRMIEKMQEDNYNQVALLTDLSRESTSRYDANADSLALLADMVSSRKSKLFIMHPLEGCLMSNYIWILRERLIKRGLAIPEIPLFLNNQPRFHLENNPHPSSEGARTMALWAAKELLDQGCLSPGQGNPLPEITEETAACRAPARSKEEILARAEQIRSQGLLHLKSEINMETGEGINQVYGGINPDGTMNFRFLGLLKAGGPRLHVALAPLSESTLLCPLEVAVHVDGAPVGTLRLTSPDPAKVYKAAFTLPARKNPDLPMEVYLHPAGWIHHVSMGRSMVASCRILSLRCPAE